MDAKVAVRVVLEYAQSAPDGVVGLVGFVNGRADVSRLRAEVRLVGVAVGAAAAARDDGDGVEDEHSVAVQLSMAEIAVGVSHGYLYVIADDADDADTARVVDALARVADGARDEPLLSSMDKLALLRLRVFVDLWRRGNYVAFGSKFGVDFLVYEADPSSCHSFAMVVVKDYAASFATVDVVSHCRVAKMVKKQLLFASLQNGQIVYLSLDHAVLAAARPERR